MLYTPVPKGLAMYAPSVFTELDRFRLGTLLGLPETRSMAAQRLLDELAWRLEEATAVASERVSADVVTMNSTLRLVEVDTRREIICTIVYPEDLEFFASGVSVLGPMGSVLIGHETGDMVEWWEGGDAGRWRIAEIISQPEQVGNFHL
jgi:regulator of nucleoside diphosphate kinase